jgi:flagellar biosynthesis protein FliQ
MTPETVMTIGRHALELTVMLAAPLLLVTLAVGLLVGIFQAATQINEMTLSFIPKLLAMAATLLLFGPWMLSQLIGYTRMLITSIPSLIG